MEDRYGGPPSTWFQMRLWSQAKTVGVYTARCIVDFDRLHLKSMAGCNFDTFAQHISRFFGHKVVLLGRYNGQGLGRALERVATAFEVTGAAQLDDTKMKTDGGDSIGQIQPCAVESNDSYQVLLRITPGKEYIKVILGCDNVVKGAMLIGDAADEFSGVFENLILAGSDVSHLGVRMLDPEFDLEDYFDYRSLHIIFVIYINSYGMGMYMVG